MDKIDFPGLEKYARGIGSDGVWRSPRFANYKIAEKCIDGLATKYSTALVNCGELRAFIPGCFDASLRDNKDIQFLIQHDAANCIGSTRTNLTIVDDGEVGLAFRLRVPNTMPGQIAARMVENGNRAGMSIGYSILEDEVHCLAGHQVRLITRATLSELSLVRAGAVRRAFATVVDGARTPAPRAGNMSVDWKFANCIHKLNLANAA